MGVREALLALLSEGPSHGYQLKAAFESATAKVWPLNVGQVYTTLERLDRDGLVVTDEDDGQRSYRLTPAGADELGAWWDAAPAEEPPPRDELMLKVLLAVAAGRDHALEVITNQRNALLMLLQQRRRSFSRRPGRTVDALVDELVTDALLMRAEADLRWLDLCEERLLAAEDRNGREAPDADNGNGRRRSRRGGRP
ncbi:MAG TPA: helix-turn-helix transcriptional regulator [Acidimicrobiales bacterium]|nr:helix-turn-helix transcriptional regulator [Acidimicrobiales bacterium]